MAFIIIHTTLGERRRLELKHFTTIGRHPQNTIQLLDPMVSKEHALIEYKNREYVLRDLHSLNGTRINGVLVKKHILKDGDEIEIGNAKLMFVEEEYKSISSSGEITPTSVESYIQKKVQVEQGTFLPEEEINDIESLRQDYEKLRISYELQRTIGSELDLNRILQRILDQSFEFLDADQGAILLFDEEGNLELKFFKTRKDTKGEFLISKSVINEVIKEKSAVLSSDVSLDSRFRGAKSIIMQGIRSAMAVPLLYNKDLLGIIIVSSQLSTGAFSEKDLHLFTNIANQAAIFIANSKLAQRIEKESLTREKFQRLLSPNLAEQVVSGNLEVKKGGEVREATVMFIDIRGFTGMTEAQSASKIVTMLNEYFELMVEIIFSYEGTLDKFIGDSIMALWGVPIFYPDAAKRAVRAALDMKATLNNYNLTRIAEGEEPIKVGMGISTGEVVVGYMGSSKTMEYTAIGDTVNVASRLCSLAQPDQIIISEESYRKVSDIVETIALSPTKVKGKQRPLKIYNVIKLKE